MNDRSNPQQPTLASIVAALGHGLVVTDADGQVVWIDEATRRAVNGGLQALKDAASTQPATGLHCVLTTADIVKDGTPVPVCVVREIPNREPTDDAVEIAAAIETVMADSSWFTRTVVEKFRALRQVPRPAPAARDLDMLTDRERDILALICEGRSDLDMSRILGLSQNTVRNHAASLYRKIGVNRRSAAIIWARERAITPHDVLAQRPHRARRPPRGNDQPR
jgi:DNA-binding NarL/FixJ family response regulator